MTTAVAIAAVIGGFIGLAAGAEYLVRGGSSAARTLGMSPLVVGLTVVAYGTSAPELVASVMAAVYRHPDVTLGNVLGSNIANIGLILGLTALVAPVSIPFRLVRKEVLFMVSFTLIFFFLAFFGQFGRVTGVFFLTCLVWFNILTIRSLEREPEDAGEQPDPAEREPEIPSGSSLGHDLLLVGAGMSLLFAGGHFLVEGSVFIARTMGVSEAVIGVTLVAIGTSMPELATSVVAALRKQAAISIGNLVGSNIFNILGAIGLSACIRPFEVSTHLLRFEFPLLLVFTAAMGLVLLTGRQVSRREGGLLLAGYLLFIAAVVRPLFS